jgi:hypothetical protein
MKAQQGLAHAGFNDYIVFDNKLFVSTYDLPIEVYDLSDSANIHFSNYIYESFDSVTAIDHSGDSLFIAYPNFREVALIDQFNRDTYFLINSFYGGASQIDDIKFVSDKVRGVNLILLERFDDIAVHYVNDSGEVEYGGRWTAVDDLKSLQFKDAIAMTFIILTAVYFWIG